MGDDAFAARDYDPDMIIASAQLNDWGMTSALDAVALTDYLMSAYNIDPNRVYLSGYSGGGETGSLVMALRPELYAAYLMMASQWDGELEPLAEARTPVYMIIGEDDSYYGSESLKNTYAELHTLYEAKGLSDAEINDILVLNVKDADWFKERGISDQHGGGMAFPEESGLLECFFSKTKKG
ncbi:MAG: prolyl oligopeptidase family serine peptidase [Clostridia bacterium]|nr:prolyl oligopeptidase family serine peptidase [Clostridia bacterium]